jgi:hypothetical protein
LAAVVDGVDEDVDVDEGMFVLVLLLFGVDDDDDDDDDDGGADKKRIDDTRWFDWGHIDNVDDDAHTIDETGDSVRT